MAGTEMNNKQIVKATDTNTAHEGSFFQRNMPNIMRLLGRGRDPVQNVKAVQAGLEKLGIEPPEGRVGIAYTAARKALQDKFDEAYQKLETAVNRPLNQAGVYNLESFMQSSPKEQRRVLKLLDKDDRKAIGDAVKAYQREIRGIAVRVTELVDCTKKVDTLPEGSRKSELVSKLGAATDTAAITALSKAVAIALKSQKSVEDAEKLTESIAKTADLIDSSTKLVSTGAEIENLVVLDDSTATKLQGFMKSRMEEPQKALEKAQTAFANDQSEANLEALQNATAAAQKAFKAVQAVFTVVAEGLKDYGDVKSSKTNSRTGDRLDADNKFSQEYNRLKGLGATSDDLTKYNGARERLESAYYAAVTKAVTELGKDMTAEELKGALQPFEERRKQLFKAEGLKSEEAVKENLVKYKDFLGSGLAEFEKGLGEKLDEVVEARTTSPKKESEEVFSFT